MKEFTYYKIKEKEGYILYRQSERIEYYGGSCTFIMKYYIWNDDDAIEIIYRKSNKKLEVMNVKNGRWMNADNKTLFFEDCVNRKSIKEISLAEAALLL